MKSRPYAVTNIATGKVRLIEGNNIAQVSRHIAATEYRIEPAKAMDALRMVSNGVKLESACKSAAGESV